MESKKLTTPQLTQAEINAISSPSIGELAFNTNTNELNYYNGSSWASVVTKFSDIWAANTLINC